LICSGLLSGLTMGLMSIDQMNLQILINGGSPSQKKYGAFSVTHKFHLSQNSQRSESCLW